MLLRAKLRDVMEEKEKGLSLGVSRLLSYGRDKFLLRSNTNAEQTPVQYATHHEAGIRDSCIS